MSNVYEERATMIAAGELQSFVPFGREHCKNHPNAVNIQLRQLQPASELWSSDGAAGLVGSLQEVTLHENDRVCHDDLQSSCYLQVHTGYSCTGVIYGLGGGMVLCKVILWTKQLCVTLDT